MKRYLISLLGIVLPVLASAQDAPRDTARLAGIVISATRLSRPWASVSSSVTVLSGETLRAQGIQTVADALRVTPGAALVQSGSFGAVTSLFLRGGESDYVQVLVDGVQLNGPGGAFNFASLSTDNVERIEVVAGPASVRVEQEDERGRWRLAAVYFSQRFRDLIQFTFAPANPTGPNFYNVAAADAAGVEVTAGVNVAGFVADASHTNLRTNVTDAGFDIGPNATFVENQRLLRRPTHLASARLSRALAGHGSLGAAIRYVGDRDDIDFSTFDPVTFESPRALLPGRTLVDLFDEAILHRAQPHVAATIRIENLFDKVYADVFNFPAPGRTVTVGGRLAF